VLIWRCVSFVGREMFRGTYGAPHQSFGTFAVNRDSLPKTVSTRTASRNGVFVFRFAVEAAIFGGFPCSLPGFSTTQSSDSRLALSKSYDESDVTPLGIISKLR
jgi:hypothetical protein